MIRVVADLFGTSPFARGKASGLDRIIPFFDSAAAVVAAVSAALDFAGDTPASTVSSAQALRKLQSLLIGDSPVGPCSGQLFPECQIPLSFRSRRAWRESLRAPSYRILMHGN